MTRKKGNRHVRNLTFLGRETGLVGPDGMGVNYVYRSSFEGPGPRLRLQWDGEYCPALDRARAGGCGLSAEPELGGSGTEP